MRWPGAPTAIPSGSRSTSRPPGARTTPAGFAVRAAGGARRALAFDRAARWCRVAMELYGDDPLGEALRVELGDTLAAAGRGFEEAAEVYLAAQPGPDVARALDLRGAPPSSSWSAATSPPASRR